MKFLPYGI